MTIELYSEEYLAYQTNRSALRRFVRKFYLRHVRNHTRGRVLDFGCGVGEHLATFPEGSLGLEINPATVAYCQARKLNVRQYHPDTDDYRLADLPVDHFGTLVISHVLEHLDQPDVVLKKLMSSCRRLKIGRVFVTVPCAAGYRHDKTHRTFITKEFVLRHGLDREAGYRLTNMAYFPVNLSAVGGLFTYNELFWVCDSGA